MDPTSEGVTLSAGTVATLTFTAKSDIEAVTTGGFELVLKELYFAGDNDNHSDYAPVQNGTVTVTVSPASSEPDPEPVEGYAVSASADQEVVYGENAQVTVTVSSDNNETYNAYDLSLTYNADKLTYVSAAAADKEASVDVTEENGTIRVKGYGADKNVGTAAVTLTFTAKAVGATEVTITSAKVDKGSSAIENNAPAATILDATTVITVSGYPVNLGEGLSGAGVVAPNEDYTFSATDADDYDYVVTATMGGEAVEVIDNGDGTYTIKNVTGALVINASMTPKSYTVTVYGTGKDDVSAANTATYNTPYSFTVTEDSGYTYTVSVTVGGKEYSLAAPADGTYTIAGTDVTGNIVITVNKTAKPATTVNVTKPDYVTGSSTAEKGKDYTFSINKEDGYTYGELTVTVGGTDITENLVENDDGSYTIPGAYVTADIVIEVTKTADITVDVVEYITLNKQSMFLITVSGDILEDHDAKYDGMSMFWSREYNAFAYLVISAEDLDAVKAAAAEKITVVEMGDVEEVMYNGDVNGTTVIDVNDAQLTYDMYNAKYDSFDTVSMLKFLRADVNGDKTVSVADAATIIAAIQ
ncbi:MAG: cohesin domain-containing protein [Faecousia sp.]